MFALSQIGERELTHSSERSTKTFCTLLLKHDALFQLTKKR